MGLDQVIFCINSDVDLVLYRELLPQYFPRSKQEELDVISKLPADTGTIRKLLRGVDDPESELFSAFRQ